MHISDLSQFVSNDSHECKAGGHREISQKEDCYCGRAVCVHENKQIRFIFVSRVRRMLRLSPASPEYLLTG